jgi:wyosine [tRNA(Phe)-imidazoG37] synthetase (radical SAM superfamily)
LIGFPFENEKHLKQTQKLIFDLNTDFIEISIVTPFYGSELYSMLNINDEVFGKDSFKENISCSKILTIKQLQDYRKKIILKYHLRFKYILGRIFNKNTNFSLLKNYIVYGFRLIKNLFS